MNKILIISIIVVVFLVFAGLLGFLLWFFLRKKHNNILPINPHPFLPINPLFPIINPLIPVNPFFPPKFNWPNNTTGNLMNLGSGDQVLGFTLATTPVLAMTQSGNQKVAPIQVIKTDTTIKLSYLNAGTFYIAKDLSIQTDPKDAATWYYLVSTGQVVDNNINPNVQWGLEINNGIKQLTLNLFTSQPQLNNVWIFKE